MALYQNGILISGANTLPKMTLAEYNALPVADRPTYWERTDLNYSDYIKYVNDSTTYTLPTVGNAVDVTKSVALSGYKLVAITNISPNTSNTAIGTFVTVNDNTAFMSFINMGNSSQAGQTRTASWTNVYMKV